jgi:hypothetical protein
MVRRLEVKMPKPGLTLVSVVLGLLLPMYCRAQTDSTNDVSLGELARTLRQRKTPVVQTVIDNDNMSKIMDQVEAHRQAGTLMFSFDNAGKTFHVSSPDVTCSLSFNSKAASLLSAPFISQELPESELGKLDGPASIEGDTLQLSVYNGTAWSVKEITIGLTILRRSEKQTAQYGSARLITAAETTPAAVQPEKHSDLTILYHLKGAAEPFKTTVFKETLGATLGSDQDWHWAIVQAKGIPPTPKDPPPTTPAVTP